MPPVPSDLSSGRSGEPGLFSLGAPILDQFLRGGLERGAMHEILAEPAHRTTASGFCIALAVRALRGCGKDGGGYSRSRGTNDHLIWLRQSAAVAETGAIHGAGLAGLGLDPSYVTFVVLRTPMEMLRAGIETVRCAAVGCVILELAGTGQAADLKATRRLVLAAEQTGVVLFVLRDTSSGKGSGDGLSGGVPSAAWTRWGVRPVSQPSPTFQPGLGAEFSPMSCARTGDAPRFDTTLLRHRAGLSEKRWQVEWNRDRHTFEQPASGEQPDFGEQSGSGECLTSRSQASAAGEPAVSRPLVPVPPRRALAA